MDGDQNTYFKSAYGMDDGDDFMLLLSRPMPLQSLRVVTGDADNQDALTDGFVDTSPDGEHYTKAASFNAMGVAEATLQNQPIMALRIRLNPHHGLPSLLVREITLNSPVKLTHAEWGPGRGFVDISQAPDLAEWARKAEQQMEEFWPATAALLYSDGFITPNMVNVVYRTGPGVTDVAATGGGVMTVNSKWCRQHPEDTGLTVHETAHVIQATRSYNPVWLVEGVADYIRWIRFEPENYHARLNAQTATYHDSYRTSATFLAWCELHYDSRLVTKLNQDVRFGNYKNDLFQKYCGKDVDALWAEFMGAYKADPTHIVTPLVAEADRPRPLPTVRAGTGLPVSLEGVFNTTGLSDDGTTIPGAGGFDGEGSTYSSKLLGATLSWKDVQFKIGPPPAANIISSRGNVIPLRAGNYHSLWLLGSGVEGSQMAQILTVTYTDGTTQTLVQNFSDWFQPQSFPGESRAIRMPYRNVANGAQDTRPFYVYSYGFDLNPAKTVKSLTLPNNPYVKILAVTLAN